MKKHKIGYTTGVFDLFHIGHLNILKQAKEHCESLVVGVSTDEVVASYKGKLPIIPFEERAALVEAVRYVDLVVPQSTMDKMVAWKTLQFNVMFHGDDWKGSPMWVEYESKFAAVGVEIIYFSYTHGTSSTKLARALEQLQTKA